MSRHLGFRWSREPSATGLARVCQGPRGWILKHDGVRVGTVSAITTDLSRVTISGWYWYGGIGETFRNTYAAGKTYATPADAKEECLAFCRDAVRGRSLQTALATTTPTDPPAAFHGSIPHDTNGDVK